MGERRCRRWFYPICAFLILITVVVYWQVADANFVNFDDNLYVSRNPRITLGLSAENVAWAFRTTFIGNWHPLTWMSHFLDYEIGEMDPRVCHITNLLFHVANVALLFVVLNMMTGRLWRSAFVAAVFAVHPLHVESVAWIAERKDVLSTFFWLLTMLAYAWYARKRCAARYLVVVGLFILGIMSKPMLVTLPLVLLLLDYWPLRRTDSQTWRELALEKTPLFVLSAASSVVTYFAQQASGAMRTLEMFPLGVRLANALVAYVVYVEKTLWPTGLAAFYPHPGKGLPVWLTVVSGVLLAAATYLAIRAARKQPYVAVGWLWYVITLVPVIGLVQVGSQAMADRYTYLPLIGLFIVVAWAVPDLTLGRAAQARATVRGALLGFVSALAVLVILGLSMLAYTQVGYWHDAIALWAHTSAVTRRNAVAYGNLGLAQVAIGETDNGISNMETALRINPKLVNAHNNLGGVMVRMGRTQEAIDHFKAAIRIKPDYANAHLNLGLVYLRQSRFPEAVKEFERVIEITPRNRLARMLLTRARGMM
jgi:hypothetical protein